MLFYTFLIILLYVKNSLSICIQNYEYMNHTECVPCTKCQPSQIVIATCNQLRDTYCGPSAFIKQSDFPFRDDQFKSTNMQLNSNSKDVLQKPLKHKKIKCDKFKNKRRQEICRKNKFNKKSNPQYMKPASDNMVNSEITNSNYDLDDIIFPTDSNTITNMTTASTTLDKQNEIFWTKHEVKLSILISFVVFDSLLILVLVILFYKNCISGNKSQNRGSGQKLPNPSNTPVKCRFTAVLPSNSPQCLNDSPASTLLRSNHIPHHESGSMSQYSLACSRADYLQSDFVHEYPDSSLSLPRTNPHSTFHPRENSSHYDQPPNSYVMDRLLAENRNGDGHLPMENNVYIETWRNDSSPVADVPREMSVPFFAGFQAHKNYSSTSSPIMLRTYRQS